MVKGISRQVIVVHGPSEEIFDQAIFILKDKAVAQGVTDEMLLKQAQQASSQWIDTEGAADTEESKALRQRIGTLFIRAQGTMN